MDDEQKFGPVLHRLSFAKRSSRTSSPTTRSSSSVSPTRRYREMAQRAAFVTADGEDGHRRPHAGEPDSGCCGRCEATTSVASSPSTRASRARSSSPVRCSRWPTGCPLDAARAAALGGARLGRDDERRARSRSSTGCARSATGERGMLTNARCLSEGVDVPTLDGVAFIDPRRSQVDIVQAVGRAMRKADDKTVGTIVIPVFVDENADPETGARLVRVRPGLAGREGAPRPRRRTRRGTRRTAPRAWQTPERRRAANEDRARPARQGRGSVRPAPSTRASSNARRPDGSTASVPHPRTAINTATFAYPSGSSWTMDSVSEAGSAVGAHSAGRTRWLRQESPPSMHWG